MTDILKFGILFLLVSVVLAVLGSSLTVVFDMLSAGLNYATTGNVGVVLTEIIGFVGYALDLVFLSTTTTYTTHFGGFEIYSLNWLFTFVRVMFGLAVVSLIIKLIID